MEEFSLRLGSYILNIMTAFPVGTASVERSFSQMKLIKSCLRSRLSDTNLEHLMKIAIEGPHLSDIEILDISKQKIFLVAY